MSNHYGAIPSGRTDIIYKVYLMHCYIISYDLCQPSRDYTSLHEALKKFPNWGKLTESTWAIVSDHNCVEIRDYLMTFIDSNDRIIVIQSGQHAAWNRIIANNQWAKDNLVL